MKKILLYKWGALSEDSLQRGLQAVGFEVIPFFMKRKDYDIDGEFSMELLIKLHSKKFDYVFSYDYFPIVSTICEMVKINYISWIYDSPHNTLYSNKINSPYNTIFVFDKKQLEDLVKLGVKQAYYLSLATDTTYFKEVIEQHIANQKNSIDLVNSIDLDKTNNDESFYFPKYESDISFVGSLYSDQYNYFDELGTLSKEQEELLQEIIESQVFSYGENNIRDNLNEELTKLLMEQADLELGPNYCAPQKWMAASVLNKKVTVEERKRLLQNLALHYSVDIYTGSKDVYIAKAKMHEYVDYNTKMPLVFHNSKININITLRSIESGIPLRALDIMACGGFLLSNYQSELAEYFVDGEELVLFHNEKDLMEKVEYYLTHEEERQAIAHRGNEKVKRIFTFENKLFSLFHVVEQGSNHYSKEYLNSLLQLGDSDSIDKLVQYATSSNMIQFAEHDNQLAQMKILCDAYLLEKRFKVPTVFSYVHSLEQAMNVFVKVKFFLRRIELDLPKDLQEELIAFMEEYPISRFLLMMIGDNAIYNKEKVCIELAKMFEKCGKVENVKPILFWGLPQEEKEMLKGQLK